MLTSETKRRIDACRDVLVGKLPLPTDQVELITLALIYKFMDDLDQESLTLGGKRSFFTGDLAKYRWRNLLPQTVSAEQRVTLFSEGMEALGSPKKAAHLPGLFRDIFRNAFLKFRDGRILTLFLTEINGFEYSQHLELGDAFEYLLQCMGTQGENGQFRSPRHIIGFMVACLDPQPGDRILDPACGTAGFLVCAYRHILARYTSPGSTVPGDQLTHAQRQQLYANLIGYDITDLMVKLSKVNLFLHGFPDPAIHIYDTLSNDARWHEKADIIFANPPFMTPKGGVTPHTRFRIAAKKAEVLFTDYIAEHPTPDGCAGIIVPNGIVATTQNAYVKLRRFLVEDSLVAVVSLPAGVFKPYSGVKTSILLLDRKLARQTKEILFLKITADGFDLGDKRNPIEANDLPEAERVVKAWLGRAKGPTSYQHGATPHEPTPEKGKGLKARSIAAADESGLQPSEMFLNEAPGALPQAAMSSAVGAGVVWKAVEKNALLEHRACSLQAETFFGEKAVASSVKMVALGDVATLGSGGTPSKANVAFWRGDIPWVSPKDMKSLVLTDTEDHISTEAIESSATKLLPAGTVLCVVRSGILRHTLPVAITARPMCTNQDILAITPDKTRLDPKFLLFALKGRSAEILRDGIKTGVTVQSFHNGFFKTYEIPLPPLEEQRRIVAEIEGYQKVLDGARQILDALSHSLEIDPDWELVPFGTICENLDGKRRPITKSDRKVGPYPYYGASGVVDSVADYIFDEPLLLVSEDGANLLARSTPIAFSVSGKIWVNNHAHVVRFPDMATQRFVEHYLNSISIANYVTGAAQPKLNQAQLNSIPIPLPPLAEQRRIVAELDAEAEQMEAVRSLLPRFEAKIQRVLDRVWGNGIELSKSKE